MYEYALSKHNGHHGYDFYRLYYQGLFLIHNISQESDELTDTIPVVEDGMERFDPAYTPIFRATEGQNIQLLTKDDDLRTYWRWNPNTETHETDPSSGFTSEFE